MTLTDKDGLLLEIWQAAQKSRNKEDCRLQYAVSTVTYMVSDARNL